MNFNARQYDPQIGRFLSIDPLAYVGGQQVHSPYAAMGNNPGMMIDPNGTRSKYALDDLTNAELIDAKRGYILGTGFSSSNTGGLKVPFGMNNTMLEYAGGGGFNVGSNVFSNFGKAVRKFFSLFGNKASSNVEPSTGNKATAKDEENDNSEHQNKDGEDPIHVSTNSNCGVVINFISPFNDEERGSHALARKLAKTVRKNTFIVIGHTDGTNMIDVSSGIKRTFNGVNGLDLELNDISKEYRANIANKNPSVVILFGCETAEIAQKLSKKYNFLTVIGSNGFVNVRSINGSPSRIRSIDLNLNSGKNDGHWKIYKNGKEIDTKPPDYLNDY